ncbi:YbaB/EbfC family nucleoid-associated protein [Lentisphaerota bacterium ZTH]|nr:YbaB/EbfC family nucleoid-associated protein [Lentisphaerota bacterium]WET07203.1 YbaB/EbfC family nucleoid-associated protein [Lentisphaerota bacterium ZTH]
MFGNLGEMAGMMKKAKDIQKNLKNMKEEMAKAEFSGSCAGGKVEAVVSGDMIVKKVKIASEVTSDAELLEDMVTAAVNTAINNAKNAAQERMNEATGGLDIPGLF